MNIVLRRFEDLKWTIIVTALNWGVRLMSDSITVYKQIITVACWSETTRKETTDCFYGSCSRCVLVPLVRSAVQSPVLIDWTPLRFSPSATASLVVIGCPPRQVMVRPVWAVLRRLSFLRCTAAASPKPSVPVSVRAAALRTGPGLSATISRRTISRWARPLCAALPAARVETWRSEICETRSWAAIDSLVSHINTSARLRLKISSTGCGLVCWLKSPL